MNINLDNKVKHLLLFNFLTLASLLFLSSGALADPSVDDISQSSRIVLNANRDLKVFPTDLRVDKFLRNPDKYIDLQIKEDFRLEGLELLRELRDLRESLNGDKKWTDVHKALVRLTIIEVQIAIGDFYRNKTNLNDAQQFGDYLTQKYSKGQYLYARGLQLLYKYFMSTGPEERMIEIAERLINEEENIRPIAEVSYSDEVPERRICRSRLNVLESYLTATINVRDQEHNQKILKRIEESLSSNRLCIEADAESLKHAYFWYSLYLKRTGDHQRSLAINGKIAELESGDPRGGLRSKINLIHNYRRLGDFINARKELESAIPFAEIVGQGFKDELSQALASILVETEDYDNARALIVNLINMYNLDSKAQGASNHDFGYMHLFRLLSRLEEISGFPHSAILMQKMSVESIDHSRRSMIEHFEFQGGASIVNRIFEEEYRRLATLLTNQGRLIEAQAVLDMLKEDEHFEFIRRSAVSDPRHTRLGHNATEQSWMSRYRQISDRLATLGAEDQALKRLDKVGLSAAQKQRQQALAADLLVAQAAFQSFLEEMRQDFARRGPARSTELTESSVMSLNELRELIKGLGDDVVLLQYYVTDDQVGMLLTTPGVQLARSAKVSAKDLNRQIADFRRLLRDPKSDPLPAAQALYQVLVAPVAQDLQQAGAKTVMLSLDGALRYLPFAALHDGRQYLMQRWSLPMYTSVARGRLRDAVTPQWLAVGLGVTRRHGDFDPLPAVRAEISGIIGLSSGGVLPGEIYLDDSFTAQRLKDVSQRGFQLLHVASHFRFSPGTEANSFLLLGDGQQLTLGDIRTQNYRFDDVDLLTLSACETGLGGGRDELGREIEGFGVIAQQQGAKAVLATLWPVADQSTAILMADLYRRRQALRLSKIEALRQSQMALQTQTRYSHPFYWAPFVLMGNWK